MRIPVGGAFGAVTVAAALGLATPVAADDVSTCRNERGPVAISACTRLIESGRQSRENLASFYNSRGIKKRLENDIDGAIADYTRSIDLNPLPATYSNRGNSKRLKGDLVGGVADFSAARRADPRYAPAYSNRGLIWEAKNDDNRAIQDFSKAIELKPDYTSAYTNRGRAYERKGDLQRARADFTKAVSLPEGEYSDGRWGRETARKA
jgi:tetratricopeptide (TPR) repeat protein